MAQKGTKTNWSTVLNELFWRTCRDKRYWNTCWTSEQWMGIINSVYPDAKPFNFTKTDLNIAVGHDSELKNCKVVFGSMTNNYGIYSQSHWRDNIRTVAYYATEPGKGVNKPPSDNKWWDQVINRTPSMQKIVAKKDLLHGILSVIVDESEKKRLKTNEGGGENYTLQKETDDNIPATVQPTKKSKRIKAQSYWDLPEAKALFAQRMVKEFWTLYINVSKAWERLLQLMMGSTALFKSSLCQTVTTAMNLWSYLTSMFFRFGWNASTW